MRYLDLEAGVVMAVSGLVGRVLVETFVDTFADVSVEERAETSESALLEEAQTFRDGLAFLISRTTVSLVAKEG